MIYQVLYIMLLASQFREYFHPYKLFIYFFNGNVSCYGHCVCRTVSISFGREIVHVLHEKSVLPLFEWSSKIETCV